MKKIIFLLIVNILTPFLMRAQITSKQLVRDFRKIEGVWTGSLTYLDYNSGKPYTMAANLEIKRTDKTKQFLFINTYPKEKSANSTDTITISADGKFIANASVISRKHLSGEGVQIITEKKGEDGNSGKTATIRQTYTFGKCTFSKRKDVRYTNEKNWIKRHEFIYIRKDQSNQIPFSRIDSIMQVASSYGIFNGNILIAKNDEVIYQKSFGFADGKKENPLNLSMKFDVGSISKEFNGVGIMLLKERGKLSLSAPLSQFFPEFPAWAQKIQIKHLINYTSGIPQSPGSIAYGGDASLYDFLKKTDSLSFEPGTQYDYNYADVYLQRQIIERISKMTYADFIEKNIFDKAGMKDSSVDYPVSSQDMAQSFDDEGVHTPYPANFKGYVRFPIHDLFLWEKALWSGQIISKQSLMLLSSAFATGESSLGRVSFINGRPEKHSHQGSNSNYEALVTKKFGNDIIIVMMTNNQQLKVQALGETLSRALQNDTFTIPRKSFYLSIREKLLMNVDDGLAYYKELKNNHADIYDFSFEVPDLLNSGKFLQRRKKNNEAIKVFEVAIKLKAKKEDLSYAYELMGDSYNSLGQQESALENYKKATELDEGNKNAASKYQKLSR